MDPLSEMPGLMKPNSFGFRGVNAGGDWAIVFSTTDGLKCFAIHSGMRLLKS